MPKLFDFRNVIKPNIFIKESKMYLNKYIVSILNKTTFEYEFELLNNIDIEYNEIIIVITNYYRSINISVDIEDFLIEEIDKLNKISTTLKVDIDKLYILLVNEIIFNPKYIKDIHDILLNTVVISVFHKLSSSYIQRYACVYINSLQKNLNLNDHIENLWKLGSILPNNIWIYINHYYSKYILINILSQKINTFALTDYISCYYKLKTILYCKFTNHIDNIISKLYIFVKNSMENILDTIYIISAIDNIFNFSSKHRIIFINLLSQAITEKTHQTIQSHINQLILNKTMPIDILSKGLLYTVSAFENNSLFFEIYYEYLIKRLETYYLSRNINNIKYELDVIKLFAFTYNHSYKSVKLINDFIDSFEVLNYINIEHNILITSISTLDIDSTYNIRSDCLPKFEQKGSIDDYVNKYKHQYNFDINIFFHLMYGKIIVKLHNSIITMLPIHYLLLNEELSLDNIKERATKYGICDNNTLERLEQSFTGCFDGNDINLIEQFYNFTIFNNDRAFSNREVINSMIVNILKTQSIDKNSLYLELKRNINLFIPSLKEFNESIDYLMEMDYINETDNKRYIFITNIY
jgi:hypothetical protein